MRADLDAHGQPVNPAFNRMRRVERDVSELLGLVKGVLADGVITEEEAIHVGYWIANHPESVGAWRIGRIAERIAQVFSDGRIDDSERRDLQALLSAVAGGTAGVIVGRDAPTELPLDTPAPVLVFPGSVFVFTGRFAFGPRKECQHQVELRGGSCDDTLTQRTNYLVIGTFGSRDWLHTSFGRKIQKAVQYRTYGHRIAIVGEDHWASGV